jgi:NDP-4-keto-2,6-dideoxyhexose 3-C-methyltransferase
MQSNSVKAISHCRICGSAHLVKVLDLGEQTLTGVFPKSLEQKVTSGPLQLVKCNEIEGGCGLLQMAHSYDLDEMYGDNYGYRSGLNQSMVRHLSSKIKKIETMIDLSDNPIVVDIGSNDGTSLAAYTSTCVRVGIDPTAEKFRQYYEADIEIIADFFNAHNFHKKFPHKKARVVTSFSMFYDLESPMDFVQQIAEILDERGVWVFEQSYLPTMLSRNSFDTVCHEHLEYYAFTQIQYLLKKAGLKAIDVEFNDVNGGSFSITAALQNSFYPEWSGINELLNKETYLSHLTTYEKFSISTIKML